MISVLLKEDNLTLRVGYVTSNLKLHKLYGLQDSGKFLHLQVQVTIRVKICHFTEWNHEQVNLLGLPDLSWNSGKLIRVAKSRGEILELEIGNNYYL